jgi:hypothetical protein
MTGELMIILGLGYIPIGILLFLATVFIAKIGKLGLFYGYEYGQKVKTPFIGVCIILFWPIVIPIMAIIGFVLLVGKFCDLIIADPGKGVYDE